MQHMHINSVKTTPKHYFFHLIVFLKHVTILTKFIQEKLGDQFYNFLPTN